MLGVPGLDLRGGFRFAGFRDITITAINGSSCRSRPTTAGPGPSRSAAPPRSQGRPDHRARRPQGRRPDRLRQTKANDGLYTIDRVRVVLPVAGGQVTAVGTDPSPSTRRVAAARRSMSAPAPPMTSTATPARSSPTSRSARSSSPRAYGGPTARSTRQRSTRVPARSSVSAAWARCSAAVRGTRTRIIRAPRRARARARPPAPADPRSPATTRAAR